jgi:hypothetical protein
MADDRPRDEPVASSDAEREGIVDQQDAALSAVEELENPDDDPMQGEAPTG